MEAGKLSKVAQPFGFVINSKQDSDTSTDEDETDVRKQVTSQTVIDSLSRYTIKPNGAYSRPECACSLCYCSYRIGDRIVCLPCQHNFHEYCIENWLKWVKPTCPIDKKSVARRAYVQELMKERQNRLLDAYCDKIQVSVSSDEENSSSSENEVSIIHNIRKKEIMKRQRYQKVRGTKSRTELSQKILSPLNLKSVAKSKEQNDLQNKKKLESTYKTEKGKAASKKVFGCQEQNAKMQVEFNGSNYKQLQESVDAIRKSIKGTNNKNINKYKHGDTFQEALDTVITKLSDVTTCSPKSGMDCSFYKNRNSKNCWKDVMSQKPKRFQDHVSLQGIMGRKNLTFGDLLEIENEVTSGWVYKNNDYISLERKILQRRKGECTPKEKT